MTLDEINDRERNEIREAELFDDFAHSNGRIAAIRRHWQREREKLREAE